MSKEWESIDTYSERLKVPGGWIIRTSYSRDLHNNRGASAAVTCHTILVPDPDHTWKLTE